MTSGRWLRAGRHNAGDYLTLAAGFGREHVSGVLEEIAHRLGVIDEDLTTDATRPGLEAFHALAVAAALRGSRIHGRHGRQRRPAITARRVDRGPRGDQPGSGGHREGPRGARPIALRRRAARADRRRRDRQDRRDARRRGAVRRARTAADRAASPEDQYRYLFALGDFRDPALVEKGLQRSLSPQLRSQDTAIYLAQFLVNPAARGRAWAFVTAHWTALEPKVTISGGDTNLIRALGAFSDAGSRDEVASFFAAHPLPGAARTLTQTIEQINNCIALRDKQTPAVANWLASR